jgi:hypothetical protein
VWGEKEKRTQSRWHVFGGRAEVAGTHVQGRRSGASRCTSLDLGSRALDLGSRALDLDSSLAA